MVASAIANIAGPGQPKKNPAGLRNTLPAISNATAAKMLNVGLRSVEAISLPGIELSAKLRKVDRTGRQRRTIQMASGSVTLNGVDDEILALVFKFKVNHVGQFSFNPQTMTPAPVAASQGKSAEQRYNGMTFAWDNGESLKLVIDLLQRVEQYQSGQK
jgi:hypothetical protein